MKPGWHLCLWAGHCSCFEVGGHCLPGLVSDVDLWDSTFTSDSFTVVIFTPWRRFGFGEGALESWFWQQSILGNPSFDILSVLLFLLPLSPCPSPHFPPHLLAVWRGWFSMLWKNFHSPKASIAKLKPGAWISIWVLHLGVRGLGTHVPSAAFPGALVGRWVRSGVAGTQTSQYHRQLLSTLFHCTGPHNLHMRKMILSYLPSASGKLVGIITRPVTRPLILSIYQHSCCGACNFCPVHFLEFISPTFYGNYLLLSMLPPLITVVHGSLLGHFWYLCYVLGICVFVSLCLCCNY